MDGQIEMRLYTMDDVLKDTPLLELPVKFKGTADECRAYAEGEGYVWKPSKKYLLGGYFFKRGTPEHLGSELLPTQKGQP